jgi:heme A synthase
VAGRPVALVSDAFAVIGGMVALVGDAVALVGGDMSVVKRRPALGQVGLGGLEGLFGGLGTGLGLRDPEIVQGQGGQPLPVEWGG